MKWLERILWIVIVASSLAGIGYATSPMGMQKYQNNNYCEQRQIQLQTGNDDSVTNGVVISPTHTVIIQGTSGGVAVPVNVTNTLQVEVPIPTYTATGATIVRANATNVAVFAAATNWADPGRKVINPSTNAVYLNCSTNTPSAGSADEYIPPSVATNTYDSYVIIPASYQGVITASTTGLYGYGIQR